MFSTHFALTSDDQSDPLPLSTSTATPVTSNEVETTGELFSDKLLASLGYIINTRGRFLICIGCHKPILPSFASGYAHEQHNLPKFDYDLLQPYIYKYNLFSNVEDFTTVFFPSSPSPDQSHALHIAFDRVNVESVYQCSKCSHIRSTVKSVESHWRDNHKGVTFQQPIVERAQCIYLCPQFRRWLPVQPRLSSPTMDDGMQALLKAYYALPDNLSSADTNAREPPLWLRKLGWLKWISNYDSAILDDFVESVKTHPLFRCLSNTLTSYLEKAMDVLDEMPPQIRQILQSVTE